VDARLLPVSRPRCWGGLVPPQQGIDPRAVVLGPGFVGRYPRPFPHGVTITRDWSVCDAAIALAQAPPLVRL
jgi:hypothetical protein